MPLHFYATPHLGFRGAKKRSRLTTIDPALVKELLIRNCDPNQAFESWVEKEVQKFTHEYPPWDIFGHVGTNTPWENALHVALSICGQSPFAAGRLGEDEQERHQVMLEWLQALKLFLIYGADAKTIFDVHGLHSAGRNFYDIHKMSALAIFNKRFNILRIRLYHGYEPS